MLETINSYFFGNIALQDQMGPPGSLDREHAYAVLASRSGTIVAFSFATLEGAQECARLGARTRRFIAEINYPVGTWNESSHAGDDATADERRSREPGYIAFAPKVPSIFDDEAVLAR